MNDVKELQWSGKTRKAVEANMLTLYEMGDVPEGAYRAFKRDSRSVMFESDEELEAVMSEVDYMVGMGHPSMHRPTLEDKVREMRQMLE